MISRQSVLSLSAWFAGSILLTVLFWGPLWVGSGFVGGDLYPYFFPQKVFLADRLHAGEFPLWNNLTGFGYPVLGESQTGVAYPPHLVAYSLLDPNTAYNVEHLGHYILCFCGALLFGRRIGLGTSASALAAIVFTYGWFPPRACLEWAIVTGAWLPLALWCVESFLQTRSWRYAIGLSVVLGLQLLAGHFHLAFVTLLLVVSYGGWRAFTAMVPAASTDGTARSLRFAAVLLAVLAGFLLASVQLLPAWELKTRSSRASIGGQHEPSYGHLPPLYISQLVAPWLWYSPWEIEESPSTEQGSAPRPLAGWRESIRTISEFGAPWHWFGPRRNLDELLMQSRSGGLTTVATNRVEAHLYCGLVPLGLAAWWLVVGRTSKPASAVPARGEMWFWGIAAILAVIYATGWLLPVARQIPGFNFFRGPGRYGIVTTLALAILAGRGLDRVLRDRTGWGRAVIVGCVFWSTLGDLWLVSQMVKYAVMVARPPIAFRDESPVRKILAGSPAPRLYVPGQNVGNLLGVSCLPVYLGIAPIEYSDPKFAGAGMPQPDDASGRIPADKEFSQWLRACGATHILTFAPLDEPAWHVVSVWHGIDPMLNSAWGRSEPLYLYRLRDTFGRASVVAGEPLAKSTAVASCQRANRIVVESTSPRPASLVLRELSYPGWRVDINGQPADGSNDGAFRRVPVPQGSCTVTWVYRPFSVVLGLVLTVATAFLLAAIGHVRFWHRAWLDGVLVRLMTGPRG